MKLNQFFSLKFEMHKERKQLFSTLSSGAVVKLQLWVHFLWVELPHHVSIYCIHRLFLSTRTQMLPKLLLARHLGDPPLFMSLTYSQKFNHSLTHMFFLLLCTSYTLIRHNRQRRPSRRYCSPHSFRQFQIYSEEVVRQSPTHGKLCWKVTRGTRYGNVIVPEKERSKWASL